MKLQSEPTSRNRKREVLQFHFPNWCVRGRKMEALLIYFPKSGSSTPLPHSQTLVRQRSFQIHTRNFWSQVIEIHEIAVRTHISESKKRGSSIPLSQLVRQRKENGGSSHLFPKIWFFYSTSPLSDTLFCQKLTVVASTPKFRGQNLP